MGLAGMADIPLKHEALTKRVIGHALEGHRTLGPGLLESAYEQCLARELSIANIQFEIQKPLPVSYKGILLNCGYRLDFLVEQKLILELKAVDQLHEIHKAQLLTYMKLATVPVGLIISFNLQLLKDGILRMVL